MAHNVLHVCDAAPSLTEARGRCGGAARRSAAEPELPEGRRCTYALLCEVPLRLTRRGVPETTVPNERLGGCHNCICRGAEDGTELDPAMCEINVRGLVASEGMGIRRSQIPEPWPCDNSAG